MLKRKKPAMKRKRRMLDISSSRRRIKRNMAVLKLHRRRRNYQTLFQQSEGMAEPTPPAV